MHRIITLFASGFTNHNQVGVLNELPLHWCTHGKCAVRIEKGNFVDNKTMVRLHTAMGVFCVCTSRAHHSNFLGPSSAHLGLHSQPRNRRFVPVRTSGAVS